jgi:hypothetical protein
MTQPQPEHNNELSERDRLPPTERGQDPERTEAMHGLAVEDARPLTSDERRAAENDTPLPERVYAPASERVPKEPVPGHRDFVEHTDESTPERQAVSTESEPPFTRVERPSSQPQQAWTPSPMSTPYSSPAATPTFSNLDEDRGDKWFGLPIGLGAAAALAGAAVGAWFYARWRHERDKPINRWRRQALQTASEVRDRMPPSEELQRPGGIGLLATALSIAVILWQKSRSGQKRPIETVTDVDWQHRLANLKERWSPRRVEMEKFSISRR